MHLNLKTYACVINNYYDVVEVDYELTTPQPDLICHFMFSSVMTTTSPKYQAFQSRFDLLVSTVKADVGKVARKAYEKKLISLDNLNAAENLMIDDSHRASKLLIHISNKIKERDTNFDIFVTILNDIPTLNDVADEVTKAVFKFEEESTDPEDERSLESSSEGACLISDIEGAQVVRTEGTPCQSVTTSTGELDQCHILYDL